MYVNTRISERVYNNKKELIRREFAERKQRYQTEASIESARINAIKEIAMSYYQNRNQSVPNSIYIVR